MGLFEDLNAAGFLAIGTNPQWTDIDLTDTVGAPSSASSGVAVEDSPTTQVYVAMREDVSKRTSRVVIGVADLTVTVYTVIVDGNSVVYDASVELPATAALLVSGIVDKINADGTVGPIVTAVVDPDDTSTVLITGDAEPDYSINATAVGGTGTLTFNADASSCDVRVYTTPGGTIPSTQVGNAQRWVQPLDGHYPAIDYRGFTERFQTAGKDRLAVELENVAGALADGSTVVLTARIMVGPAVL